MLFAVLEAVGFTLKEQDMSVVCQAIEQRCRERGVAEDFTMPSSVIA